MVWRVALSETANADLESVVAFIAQKNPSSAERIGGELADLIFSLDHFPCLGKAVRKRLGLRKLVHSHYLIFYQVNEAAQWVEVVRIWDGRQNPANLQLP
jgi:plasmid stabilization system protein ParE